MYCPEVDPNDLLFFILLITFVPTTIPPLISFPKGLSLPRRSHYGQRRGRGTSLRRHCFLCGGISSQRFKEISLVYGTKVDI